MGNSSPPNSPRGVCSPNGSQGVSSSSVRAVHAVPRLVLSQREFSLKVFGRLLRDEAEDDAEDVLPEPMAGVSRALGLCGLVVLNDMSSCDHFE